MNFPDQLRAERARLNRNQPDTAALFTGLSTKTLRNWEIGRNAPPPWAQALILDFLRRQRPLKRGTFVERGRLWPARD